MGSLFWVLIHPPMGFSSGPSSLLSPQGGPPPAASLPVAATIGRSLASPSDPFPWPWPRRAEGSVQRAPEMEGA